MGVILTALGGRIRVHPRLFLQILRHSVPHDDMGGGELKKDKRGGGVPDDWVFRMSKSARGMTDDNASFCEEENVVLRPIKRCFPFV